MRFAFKRVGFTDGAIQAKSDPGEEDSDVDFDTDDHDGKNGQENEVFPENDDDDEEFEDAQEELIGAMKS